MWEHFEPITRIIERELNKQQKITNLSEVLDNITEKLRTYTKEHNIIFYEKLFFHESVLEDDKPYYDERLANLENYNPGKYAFTSEAFTENIPEPTIRLYYFFTDNNHNTLHHIRITLKIKPLLKPRKKTEEDIALEEEIKAFIREMYGNEAEEQLKYYTETETDFEGFKIEKIRKEYAHEPYQKTQILKTLLEKLNELPYSHYHTTYILWNTLYKIPPLEYKYNTDNNPQHLIKIHETLFYTKQDLQTTPYENKYQQLITQIQKLVLQLTSKT
jgi:hypothetical protein